MFFIFDFNVAEILIVFVFERWTGRPIEIIIITIIIIIIIIIIMIMVIIKITIKIIKQDLLG